jgi:hypothetical protein
LPTGLTATPTATCSFVSDWAKSAASMAAAVGGAALWVPGGIRLRLPPAPSSQPLRRRRSAAHPDWGVRYAWLFRGLRAVRDRVALRRHASTIEHRPVAVSEVAMENRMFVTYRKRGPTTHNRS